MGKCLQFPADEQSARHLAGQQQHPGHHALQVEWPGSTKMNCPYCNKHIPGFTGLQEAQNFQKHLLKCPKNPNQNIVLSDGQRTVVTPTRPIAEQNLLDAVNIRAKSGQ